MHAAVVAVEEQHAAEIVVAAPVATREAVEALSERGHVVVVLDTPEPFDGVGRWYVDFRPTSDDEVIQLLEAANTPLNRQQS